MDELADRIGITNRDGNEMTEIVRGRNLLYLSRADIVGLGLSRQTILDCVLQALVEHGHKRYEMPAKIGVHPYEDVFFHAMPAYLPSMKLAGMKWIECYPRNPREFDCRRPRVCCASMTSRPVCRSV